MNARFLKQQKSKILSTDFCRFQLAVDSEPGSTISTLLHDKINAKDCQVLSLGHSGFLHFFRVVSSDYGKPRELVSDLSGRW